MKYVIELSEQLRGKVADFMRRKGLSSLSDVVHVALENQLELEAHGEGPVGGHPVARAEPLPPGSAPPLSSPWADIRVDDLMWKSIQTAQPGSLANAPVWGQVNRLFPMKVSLRVLARGLATGKGEMTLQQFHTDATSICARARTYLEAYDAKRNLPRGERLSAAFPENTEKSARRFQAQFLGRVLRDGRVLGALPEFGFVTISAGHVLMTDQGLGFARLANPVLDSEEPSAEALSSEEVGFLLDHLRTRMPEEFAFLTTILRWISDGSNTPDELTRRVRKAWPQWTAKVANTMRTGALGRMHDFGLIARHKKGLRVTYTLSPRGAELVEMLRGERDVR